MLAIRMQRTGRKGHAMFRIIVQDSRLTPTSGKVVLQLGSYDPHTKAVILNKEKAAFYLEHGAQPSDRVARLLKKEGVKLPDWVTVSPDKERTVRNADKRRSTRPPEPKEEAPAEPAESNEPAVTEEAPAEEVVAEAPAQTEPEEAPEEAAVAESTEEVAVEKPEAEETAEKTS